MDGAGNDRYTLMKYTLYLYEDAASSDSFDSGRLSSAERLDAGGATLFSKEYRYSDDSELMREKNYGPEGDLRAYFDYSCNSNGTKERMTQYDGSGKAVSYVTCNYREYSGE